MELVLGAGGAAAGPVGQQGAVTQEHLGRQGVAKGRQGVTGGGTWSAHSGDWSPPQATSSQPCSNKASTSKLIDQQIFGFVMPSYSCITWFWQLTSCLGGPGPHRWVRGAGQL